MCLNHPETIPLPPSSWENCLPNRSLVPKRLGTIAIEDLKGCTWRFDYTWSLDLGFYFFLEAPTCFHNTELIWKAPRRDILLTQSLSTQEPRSLFSFLLFSVDRAVLCLSTWVLLVLIPWGGLVPAMVYVQSWGKDSKNKDKPQKSSAPISLPSLQIRKVQKRRVKLPQSLGEYHGGFSASEVGSLAGTEALFTIKVYLQDHICELVLESLLTEF